MIQARKEALDLIVSDLSHLRLLGKDTEISQAPSPAPEAEGSVEPAREGVVKHETAESSDEGNEDKGRIDTREGSVAPASSLLNPTARPFAAHGSRTSSPLLHIATHQLRLRNEAAMRDDAQTPNASARTSPAPKSPESKKEDGEEEEDIEMGEVSEEKTSTKLKKGAEDREEGEASDESSELSEPPDE